MEVVRNICFPVVVDSFLSRKTASEISKSFLKKVRETASKMSKTLKSRAGKTPFCIKTN